MEIIFNDEHSRVAFAKRLDELVDVVHEHIGPATTATVRWNGHFFSVDTGANRIRIDERLNLF